MGHHSIEYKFITKEYGLPDQQSSYLCCLDEIRITLLIGRSIRAKKNRAFTFNQDKPSYLIVISVHLWDIKQNGIGLMGVN